MRILLDECIPRKLKYSLPDRECRTVPYLRGPVFADVRSSPERFREFRVEAGTLVWPGGADLCPDVLIWGGLPPADAVSDAEIGRAHV
jgi:hypothetical protein